MSLLRTSWRRASWSWDLVSKVFHIQHMLVSRMQGSIVDGEAASIWGSLYALQLSYMKPRTAVNVE